MFPFRLRTNTCAASSNAYLEQTAEQATTQQRRLRQENVFIQSIMYTLMVAGAALAFADPVYVALSGAGLSLLPLLEENRRKRKRLLLPKED